MASATAEDLSWTDIDLSERPPLTVLVADDVAMWRRQLAEAVTAHGVPVRILEAADGAKALELLESEDIDIAFLDVLMPELSGIEVIEHARRGTRMPFVALVSSLAEPQTVERAKALRAYDYILKPLDAQAVSRVIDCHERTLQPSRVLVIDDSSTVRRIISKVLGRSIFRFSVHEAGDGITAFEHYAKHSADVVFLDLNMPMIDGASTLRILRASNPNVKVVLMSSDQAMMDSIPNVSGRMKKPFDASVIDRVMHDIYGLDLPYGARG